MYLLRLVFPWCAPIHLALTYTFSLGHAISDTSSYCTVTSSEGTYNMSLDPVPSSPFLQKSPCQSLETEPASPREATEPACAPMLRRRPEQRCTMPSSRLDGAQIRGARRAGGSRRAKIFFSDGARDVRAKARHRQQRQRRRQSTPSVAKADRRWPARPLPRSRWRRRHRVPRSGMLSDHAVSVPGAAAKLSHMCEPRIFLLILSGTACDGLMVVSFCAEKQCCYTTL